MPVTELELKKSLSTAISQFNAKRSQLLQEAFQSGGQDAVQKIEQEYDTLRDAYYEILQRQLDENHHLYTQLISAAKTEADELTKSVKQLNNINEIINLATEVINLVGRVLIVLAL
ncbi:MAG: hypothetical protein DI529_05380 [Chryseobacterium sp.]|nr:MAG: hypothetical protein DI529_05380 [Chryseobacterium sp.]